MLILATVSSLVIFKLGLNLPAILRQTADRVVETIGPVSLCFLMVDCCLSYNIIIGFSSADHNDFISFFYCFLDAALVVYFFVLNSSDQVFITWEKLREAPVLKETKFFRHVRFHKPFSIMMDGKQRVAVIKMNEDSV